jgi:DNA primase
VSKLNEIIRGQRSGAQQAATNADRQQAQQEQHEKIEHNRQVAQEGNGNNGKSPKSKISAIATLLVRLIVKHGNEIIFRNVEADDGNAIDLNVAQYIDYDLATDNLSLGSPQYEQIRQEAVEHSEDPDFNSLQYFTLHPDIEISQLAIRLSTERVILSESMKMKYDEDTLRETTSHLLLDFRKEYVRKDIDKLRQELAQPGNAPDYVTSLLKELSEKQTLFAAISKKLGSSIIVR